MFVTFGCFVNTMASWESWNVGTAPIPIGGTVALGTAIYQTGSTAPVPMLATVELDGKIYIRNKSGLTLDEGWVFVNIVYACI